MTLNLFVNETRNQLSWMNRPERWEFTDLDELTIIAPPESDFFKTRQVNISQAQHHSYPHL